MQQKAMKPTLRTFLIQHFSGLALLLCTALLLAACGAAPAQEETARQDGPADAGGGVSSDAQEAGEEAAEVEIPLSLRYDDRHTFPAEVRHLEAASDGEEILRLAEGSRTKVIACGIGEAAVQLADGSRYRVTVTAAPISLILIAGQSNGEGRLAIGQTIEESMVQYVLNEEGQAYGTYASSDFAVQEEITWIDDPVADLSIDNYEIFLPVSLTDNTRNGAYNSTNTLTRERGRAGKGGIDSAFAYRWNQLTGEKVWVINACHHGSKISSWQPGDGESDNNFWQAVRLYQGAERILSQEIEAGHYTLSHKGVLWLQGEQDFRMEPGRYLSLFIAMQEGFQRELGGAGIAHMDRELAFTGILMVRAAMNHPYPDNDFLLTGPRQAQYYLSVTPEYEDIFLASQVEEFWSGDEAVQDYFTAKYGTAEQFAQAYPTLDEQLRMPSTEYEVHEGFHYTQLGYNEIGLDAAENLCLQLGCTAQARETDASLIWVTAEDGLENIDGQPLYVEEGACAPIAIKVFPSYLAKEAQITCSENVTYDVTGVRLTGEGQGQLSIQVGQTRATITIAPA